MSLFDSDHASPNDRAVALVLSIDLLLSATGPAVSLSYWGGRSPFNEAWLGFLAGNLVLWSGVGLIGLVLVLRDLMVWARAPRPVGALALGQEVPAPAPADVTPEEFEVPTLTVPRSAGAAVPSDAPREPELVGARAD